MSEAKDEVSLHPLVEQARELLGKVAKRAKTPPEAEFSKGELKELLARAKACPDDHQELGRDFIAQAIALERHKWSKAAEQFLEIAANVLPLGAAKDEIDKARAGPARRAAATGPKSTIAGLEKPTGASLLKKPGR